MKPIIKRREIVINGNSYVVDYTYYPPIPKMAYDYDGGGHPGQEAYVNIIGIRLNNKDFSNDITIKHLDLIYTQILELEKQEK